MKKFRWAAVLAVLPAALVCPAMWIALDADLFRTGPAPD